jgi:predicted metal-dependent hydrolase
MDSAAVSEPAEANVPRPRSPGLEYGALTRHWLGGNAVATHIANGVNLLFPAGERFFVRSVKHYLDQLDDAALEAQVRGFFGQEGHHAREHDRINRMLEAQGYDVRRFLRVYEWLAYGVIERLSPAALRLATTAACEHFTAILAENALRERVLDKAAPSMRRLLLWHAAEEIEHRSVAFDVLQRVNPSYALRVGGLAMATACLGGFWLVGSLMLLAQERGGGGKSLRGELAEVRSRRQGNRVFAKGIRAYLRRDFHPSQQHEMDALARAYLAEAGLS